MFSILIPTFNNLEYLKICIESLKKNSKFDHQIIVHVNQGTDGSLDYIKEKKIEYTFTNENIGMPSNLTDMGVTEDMIPKLVAHAITDPSNLTTPRLPSQEEWEKLFLEAM